MASGGEGGDAVELALDLSVEGASKGAGGESERGLDADRVGPGVQATPHTAALDVERVPVAPGLEAELAAEPRGDVLGGSEGPVVAERVRTGNVDVGHGAGGRQDGCNAAAGARVHGPGLGSCLIRPRGSWTGRPERLAPPRPEGHLRSPPSSPPTSAP